MAWMASKEHSMIIGKKKDVREHFPACGGPLTFQRNEAITPGRVAATRPSAMIAAGNIS
jgi:hypothetical protein